MKITVKGQQAIVTDDFLVANSVGIYECEFEFDSSWDGYAKNSVWQLNNDEPKESLVSNGVAEVPWEVLVNGGFIRVGVYGTKGEKVMPTVWGEKRKVHLGTPTGSIGTEPTPSIYAQILAVATEAKDIAEDVQSEWESVTATAETLPSGSEATVEFENDTFAFGIPQGERGGDGEDGADGFSPIVTVAPITNGHRVTITDAEGVHTFDVLDGTDGQRGADGVGITNIIMNADYTLTITLSNGTSFTTPSIRGEQGATGNGISSITKTATVGKVDTYTITYTDGTTTTFDVTNGEVTEASLKEALYDKADVILNTASGTIASFSDGADMPVKSLEVEINAVQDLHGQDAPYPAGGGKNLLNYGDYSSSFRITSVTDNGKGTFTVVASENSAYIDHIISVTPNQTYCIKAESVTNVSGNASQMSIVIVYDGDTSSAPLLLNNASITSQKTFTPTADKILVRNKVTGGSGAGTGTIVKPQLELGSTATSWSPYENICPISGWDDVNVVRTGVNVWDEEWEVGTYDLNTGEPVVYPNYFRSKNPIPVVPNSSYYFNTVNGSLTGLYLLFYESDGTYIGNIGKSNEQNYEYTMPPKCKYLRFVNIKSNVYDKVNAPISINYPSTDHDYHPYNGDTYPISLGQTVYGGVLDVTSGVLTVTHGIATYDGTESGWSYNSATLGFIRTVADMKSGNAQDGYCDRFATISNNGSFGVRFGGNNQIVYFNHITDNVSGVSDLATWQTWLANNPTTIVYPLATPTTITLTPTEVTTLSGVNNIWADCGDVAVIYRADTKAYIDGTIVDVPLAMIAPIENGTTASKAYAVGEYFILNGTQFCKAKTAIASGATFTLNTNYTITTIGAELKALQ